MSDRFFLALPQRGALAVSGEDRQSFLQGLVSNDVEKVSPTRAIHAALLTAQGKYLHDFFIAELGDSLILDGEAARLADLQRRLSLYKLRAKVTIGPAVGLAIFAVFGSDVLATLGLANEAGAARPFADGIAFVDPRWATLGARILAPAETARAALEAAGLAAGDFAAYDRLRIAEGVPDGSRDLVIEKAILLESGFDELNGVDWQKGCYIGQELTARTKYRGLIKKRLLPVRLNGPAPEAGTPILREGEEVGEIRSAQEGIAIALIRLESLGEGAQFTAGGIAIHPVKPSWANF